MAEGMFWHFGLELSGRVILTHFWEPDLSGAWTWEEMALDKNGPFWSYAFALLAVPDDIFTMSRQRLRVLQTYG